jgi:hypothetical protein
VSVMFVLNAFNIHRNHQPFTCAVRPLASVNFTSPERIVIDKSCSAALAR